MFDSGSARNQRAQPSASANASAVGSVPVCVSVNSLVTVSPCAGDPGAPPGQGLLASHASGFLRSYSTNDGADGPPPRLRFPPLEPLSPAEYSTSPIRNAPPQGRPGRAQT